MSWLLLTRLMMISLLLMAAFSMTSCQNRRALSATSKIDNQNQTTNHLHENQHSDLGLDRW